ncbi:uncharacterized protein LOC100908137 [Galendromus occidentalis]|uniref:Uncharacterized protein LOC100908137 n=1 Tax=Galendromus occidentalis TaxID=34638 RepID=A0AAJ6VYW5_9ACAR|nr:uncharacterized protein LOC100908137 [Galendromus occidentalis]
MPKVAVPRNSKPESYVRFYGSEELSTDGRVLFCKICVREVRATRKFSVSQHVSRIKHKASLHKKKASSSSRVAQFLKASGKNSQFNPELCGALLSAGIPLRKLDNEKLREFLVKHCRQPVPSSVNLRLNYIRTIYDGKLEFIRSCVAQKPVWITSGETTDATGRYVAYTIVGTLACMDPRSFLLHAECLEKTNSSTIAQAFMNSWMKLWPGGIEHEKVLLFVTDGAAYIKKAAAALKILFPKMVHVTCAAHGILRIAQDMRSMFPDVDKVVSTGTEIFPKSAARVTIFHEFAPNTPLPPEPVLTRWGTWIRAAVYNAGYFDSVGAVVEAPDAKEAASFLAAQQILKKDSLRRDLSLIKAQFGGLPGAKERLEGRGTPLVESTAVFDGIVLDFAYKKGNGKKAEAYILLSTCAVSRAIALFLSKDPSTHEVYQSMTVG